MRKVITIVAVIIVLILLAGGGYYYLNMSKGSSQKYQSASEPTKSSVFSSIQDALARHLSLKCDYTDTKEVHTVAYIKNGLIRSTVTNKANPSQSGNMILKDKKMYYWNDAGTIAMVLAIPEVTGTPSVSPTQNNGQQTMAALEQYKQSCASATVEDSLFELPKDIKFQDMTKMMQAMPTGMPSGVPSGMNSQQMQMYMQKYNPSSQ